MIEVCHLWESPSQASGGMWVAYTYSGDIIQLWSELHSLFLSKDTPYLHYIGKGEVCL